MAQVCFSIARESYSAMGHACSKKSTAEVKSTAPAQAGGAPAGDGKLKVALIYYTMYGHVKTLADQVKAGLEQGGAEVTMYQVPEILPEEVLKKMGAPPKPADTVLDHAMVDSLPDFDAFVFGFPTRFGMMCSQFKSFIDGTGGLWMAGKLAGKPCACFTSTGTQGGGAETTILTAITQLTHHGMLFVPVGYSTQDILNLDEMHGGSPYGAHTLANGDGSRQPSDLEKRIAVHQGTHCANLFKKLTAEPAGGKPKIAIIYHSAYGHVKTLAETIKASVEAAGGEPTVIVLSGEITHADGKNSAVSQDVVDSLPNYDGFLFGSPTRFGMISSVLKTFWDQTAGLWLGGKLVGKPAAFFTSTGTQGGGTETTPLTCVTQFTHHGMVFVPIGYTCQDILNIEEMHGGSPWGASTYAGADGSRQPTPLELKIATHQGGYFTNIVKKSIA
mmetsp:Transcript_13438/g.32889  ORF Transcript_13438/g.32889 Transcript_13438/m.32889 type:complete len:445 (+) Transcript_13438:8-1342(+)